MDATTRTDSEYRRKDEYNSEKDSEEERSAARPQMEVR